MKIFKLSKIWLGKKKINEENKNSSNNVSLSVFFSSLINVLVWDLIEQSSQPISNSLVINAKPEKKVKVMLAWMMRRNNTYHHLEKNLKVLTYISIACFHILLVNANKYNKLVRNIYKKSLKTWRRLFFVNSNNRNCDYFRIWFTILW